MKKIFLFAFIGVASIAGISMAAPVDRYVGVKTGAMMIGINGVDDITPIGILYGHGISRNFSVEGEFNFGLSGGDYSGSGGVGEFDLWTLGVYGTYHLPLSDKAYGKAQMGFLYEDKDFVYSKTFIYTSAPPITITVDDSDTGWGLSWGLGGGYKINNRMNVEVEYTIIESDLDFLSIGINYQLR